MNFYLSINLIEIVSILGLILILTEPNTTANGIVMAEMIKTAMMDIIMIFFFLLEHRSAQQDLSLESS